MDAVPRALVVDDEPLIRWSLCETLTARGFEVVEAGDARSARGWLADSAPFDVVFLDLRLPDSNDLGLLRLVRGAMPHARVILMTAYGTHEVEQEAVQLGAFAVVHKPFEMNDVVEFAASPRPPRS
jgi:DNA-binding NtrC family response regulator